VNLSGVSAEEAAVFLRGRLVSREQEMPGVQKAPARRVGAKRGTEQEAALPAEFLEWQAAKRAKEAAEVAQNTERRCLKHRVVPLQDKRLGHHLPRGIPDMQH
jgi:hypothetical protein